MAAVSSQSSSEEDSAEKGIYDRTSHLTLPLPLTYIDHKMLPPMQIESIQSPCSPIHEGITPLSSVPVLTLTAGEWQADKPTQCEKRVERPAPVKPKPSRWILFRLWLNMYKQFFIFCILLNLTGMIMAGLGRFKYAENHLGSLVLGNLLSAILMRNELFLRCLYIIAIYGLRSVCRSVIHLILGLSGSLALKVGTLAPQGRSDSSITTRWRYSFRMCTVRCWVSKCAYPPDA